jgi:hypothetical protein
METLHWGKGSQTGGVNRLLTAYMPLYRYASHGDKKANRKMERWARLGTKNYYKTRLLYFPAPNLPTPK